MDSNSCAALKVAAMFVLVIFAGQLLIAEPAAASGTQCLKCITDCSESQQREEVRIGCVYNCVTINPVCKDV
jgi:hypothetical protein